MIETFIVWLYKNLPPAVTMETTWRISHYFNFFFFFFFPGIVFWNVSMIDDEHLNYFSFYSVLIVTFQWIARLQFSKRWWFFKCGSSVVRHITSLKATDVGLQVQACQSAVDKSSKLSTVSCYSVRQPYEDWEMVSLLENSATNKMLCVLILHFQADGYNWNAGWDRCFGMSIVRKYDPAI